MLSFPKEIAQEVAHEQEFEGVPARTDDPWLVPEADIAAWAEGERKRRQAWLEGPDEEEKRAWADAERKRRKREYRNELLDMDLDDAR
jgi:hypothetical protein